MTKRITVFLMQIAEIFASIQGESTYQGMPCIFVRLTGCNLRCTYCDTRYAYDGGFALTVDEALKKIISFNIPLLEITGGEPLLQEETCELIEKSINAGLKVLLETNGSIDIKRIDRRATVIMDLKTPGSGMSEKNCLSNINLLKPDDEIKFVITDRGDYLWAKRMVEEHRLIEKCNVLFSPASEMLKPYTLAGWILADRLSVRLQLQLHKYIFGKDKRGV